MFTSCVLLRHFAMLLALPAGVQLACQRVALSPALVLPATLSGTWTATGYLCGGPAPEQLIRITQTGPEVRAVKLRGDDCVGDDQLTWRGRYTGAAFPVQLYNAFGPQPATLRVLSADQLVLRDETEQVVTFRRRLAAPR